jgi:hypothetical protein
MVRSAHFYKLFKILMNLHGARVGEPLLFYHNTFALVGLMALFRLEDTSLENNWARVILLLPQSPRLIRHKNELLVYKLVNTI